MKYKESFSALMEMLLVPGAICVLVAGSFYAGAMGAEDQASPYDSIIPSGPVLDSILGISTHISRSPEPSRERGFELEKLSAAGVGVLRTDFTWKRIEPEDNVWRPEGYDTMLDLAVKSGIEVLAILDYGVDWAMPGGSHNEIEPEVFADYAGYAASHFGDRMRYYEVWNEPNIVRFWKPWPNPEHYGRLLEAASQAVRANDPDAVVVFGGITSHDERVLGPDGQWNFLKRVHARHPDVCEWFDVLAIHPYAFLQQTSPETGIRAINWPGLTESIEHARHHLSDIGCPEKEIWLTELGWPDTFIGEKRQAAYLARSLFLSLAAGADRWMWYTFRDGPKSSTYTEHSFGLFTWPGDDPKPKPSYEALKTAHDIAGRMRYAGDLGEALGWKDGRCRALALASDDGSWAVAIWMETPSPKAGLEVSVPLPQSVRGWNLIDQFGRTISEGTIGPARVRAGMEVIYLTFKWRQTD